MKLSACVLQSQQFFSIEGDTEPNMLLVKHFSEDCTTEKLKAYFEMEAGCSIKEVI